MVIEIKLALTLFVVGYAVLVGWCFHGCKACGWVAAGMIVSAVGCILAAMWRYA